MSKQILYAGLWHLTLHCIICDEVITEDQKGNNHGICPHCAHRAHPTWISVTKKIRREIIEIDSDEDISEWPEWMKNACINVTAYGAETKYEYKETEQ